MAYMDQNRKKELAAKIRAVLPKGWKVTFGVNNHSTFVITIHSTPHDFYAMMRATDTIAENETRENFNFSIYNARAASKYFDNPELTAIFEKIFDAANSGNHDNSDTMTDYFDVGWYVHLNVGTWNKPYSQNV